MKKKEKTIGQEFENFLQSAVKGKEIYRSSVLCSRLFLREQKTREVAKIALFLTKFYQDKGEVEVEKELDYIYNAPIETLKEEFEKRITLHWEKGFTLK